MSNRNEKNKDTHEWTSLFRSSILEISKIVLYYDKIVWDSSLLQEKTKIMSQGYRYIYCLHNSRRH